MSSVDDPLARGLNMGILTLFFLPFLLVGALGLFFAWRWRQRQRFERGAR